MSRYIDADALIKDGWHLQRTVRAENSVTIEGKDLKDVPAVNHIDSAYARGYTKGYSDASKDFQDDIRRKRGKWEIYTDEDGIYGLCSECGIDTDFSHYGEAYAYCPHCGAPMEIEE